ncbi:MAG: heavy-metal-associated domain-containing protein [Methylotetracoccus sp.]
MNSIQFKVQGMKCGGCESSVKEAVSACAGVVSVKASHKEQTVDVEYDAAAADLDAVRKAISDKGFTISS